ncbi:hypothetical protein D3C85_1564140 [compost metagenome]
MQFVAVEVRQVGHQPGALAQVQQQRRGLLDEEPAEPLGGSAEQTSGAQAIATVAQAPIEPALLLQGMQQARDGRLGQSREVVQFFQPQFLVFAQ